MSLDLSGELRISSGDSIVDIMSKLSEGNEKVMNFLSDMHVKYTNTLYRAGNYVHMFDLMGIYGKYILVLFEKCCNGKWEILEKTMNAIADEKITKEEIHKNLISNNPKLFEI